MKTISLLILLACAVLLVSCATAAPRELVDAREAYRQASIGPAAKVAPAELHVANEALVLAEKSFKNDPDSYKTKDLAYVAQRKSELAEATASISIEKMNQTQAKNDYSATQGNIVTATKQDLSQTRKALASSEASGAMVAGKLSTEQAARADADQRTIEAQAAQAAADKRAADAQAALAKLAAVKDEPRGMVITLSGSVLFVSNKYVLLDTAKTKLNQVAEALKAQDPGKRMVVEGHTDSQGSDSINQPLSVNRATAVRDYLVSRGVASEKITAVGMGSSKPITDNKTAENRANNRRVEIIIQNESHVSNP